MLLLSNAQMSYLEKSHFRLYSPENMYLSTLTNWQIELKCLPAKVMTVSLSLRRELFRLEGKHDFRGNSKFCDEVSSTLYLVCKTVSWNCWYKHSKKTIFAWQTMVDSRQRLAGKFGKLNCSITLCFILFGTFISLDVLFGLNVVNPNISDHSPNNCSNRSYVKEARVNEGHKTSTLAKRMLNNLGLITDASNRKEILEFAFNITLDYKTMKKHQHCQDLERNQDSRAVLNFLVIVTLIISNVLGMVGLRRHSWLLAPWITFYFVGLCTIVGKNIWDNTDKNLSKYVD